MKMPHAFLVVLGIILAGLILLVDLITSAESINPGKFSYVVGGVPYVAVVLTTLWMPGRSYTIVFAILSSFLTLSVLFFEAETIAAAPWLSLSFQPESLNVGLGSPVVNRTLAVFAIWITAILTIQRKSSEEKSGHLSAIVESSDDAIIGKSLDGMITSWNGGATRIYQYDAKEAINHHISFLWPKGSTGEAEKEILRGIHAGRKLEPFETLRRRKDGSLVNVSITFSPTKDEAGVMVGLAEIGRNITDRKKFEQALIEAKENAERMSRLKSSFLTNMSHEIRTPLSGILGFASILAQDANPEQYELAQLIEKSGRRLLDTINSVLDLSMLESDSFSLNPKPVDMATEVREKIALLQPLAERSKLYLKAVVPDKMCVTKIDTACLDRILNNLIGNALKFTNEGGVTVNVDADAKNVTVQVIDTGIGISKEFRSRLFHEFEQESSGMARLYEGSGLGLSITKRLVDLMDGEIQVQSAQGKGSQFIVRFPVSHEKVPEPSRPKRRRAPNRTPRRHAKAQILVVDDDPKMRTLLRLLLESHCRLDMAESEDRALVLAKNHKYDMIFQDVNLGRGRTGIDVLREFRKLPHYEHVPVVALTAYALPKDREKLLDAGFDEYLSKPISEEELRNVISMVLKEEPVNGQVKK
ncbi:MAG: ATP-binding protein [Rhodothermales bacterium]